MVERARKAGGSGASHLFGISKTSLQRTELLQMTGICNLPTFICTCEQITNSPVITKKTIVLNNCILFLGNWGCSL